MFQLGLGAQLGDGRQFFPVVSLRDWVAAVIHVGHDASLSGPVNLCAPRTPTNAEFTQALARAVHRKAFLGVPGLRPQGGRGADRPRDPRLGQRGARGPRARGYHFRDEDVHDVLASAMA